MERTLSHTFFFMCIDCIDVSGDGICDEWSNVASCGFDGGDCCEDTCMHADCDKATAERTCFDPSSTLSLCGTLDPEDTEYDYYATLCRYSQ